MTEGAVTLRSTLLRAKNDLDAIGRQLEEECAAQSSTVAPLHLLQRSVARLEADVETLELDFLNVQSAKRELLDCGTQLIENWHTVQELRASSGLPRHDQSPLAPLEDALRSVEADSTASRHL